MADITEQTNALELAQIRADLQQALEAIERLKHKIDGNGKEGAIDAIKRINAVLFGDSVSGQSGMTLEIQGMKNSLLGFEANIIQTIDSKLEANAQKRAEEEKLRQDAIDEANAERHKKADRMYRRSQIVLSILISIGTLSNLHLLEPLRKVLEEVWQLWQGMP